MESGNYFTIIEETLGDNLAEKILGKMPKPGTMFKVNNEKIFSVMDQLSNEEHTRLDLDLRFRMLEYWERNISRILDELQTDKSFKAFYLRPDLLRPPFLLEALNKLALYADKIILPDPITYGQVIETSEGIGLLRRFFGFNAPYLLLLREWVESGVVIFLPQPELWNLETRKIMQKMIREDAKKILPEIKPVAIISKRKVSKILKKANTKGINETATQLATNIDHALFTSSATKSIPTTDWGEDYYYWNWKLKHDQKYLGREAKIMYALNRMSLNWFGNVDPHYIFKLRNDGTLIETRTIFRECFAEINAVDEEEIDEVIEQCKAKLENGIIKHQQEWNDIKKDFCEKFAFKTASSIVAGLASAAVSAQLSIPSLIGALVGGGVTMTRTIEDISTLRSEQRKLKRKSIHLFFEIKQKSKEGPQSDYIKKSFGLVEIAGRNTPLSKLHSLYHTDNEIKLY